MSKEAKEFYEEMRMLGKTDSITSNPLPDYSEDFYQNIFSIMEAYHRQRSENNEAAYLRGKQVANVYAKAMTEHLNQEERNEWFEAEIKILWD